MQLISITFIAALLAAPVPAPKVSTAAVVGGVIGASAIAAGAVAVHRPDLFFPVIGSTIKAGARPGPMSQAVNEGLLLTDLIPQASRGIFKGSIPTFSETGQYLRGKLAYWAMAENAKGGARYYHAGKLPKFPIF
jgi:hypothetical protein